MARIDDPAADRVQIPVRRTGPFAGVLRWIRSWSPLVQDSVLVAVVFVAQLFALSATVATEAEVLGTREVDWLAYLIVAAATVPLLVRRRFPFSALVLCTAGLLVFVSLDYDTAFTGYAIIAALYSVVVHRGLATGLVGGLVAFVGTNMAYELADVTTSNAVRVLDLLVIATGIALGDGTRNRMAADVATAARLAQLEEEHQLQAEAAVTEERTRIARELHDLVAHSMSVVAVQAGMGHHLIDDDPAKAKEALGTIERTTRQALTEMRRMLGILRTRTDEDEPSMGPQPGLADLDRLVDELRDAGVDIDLEIGGEPRELDSGVDLSAYRIVQEALTNVIKHAGPATAQVRITFGADHVSLLVEDDGRGPSTLPSEHVGMGLVGMRERAAVVGGSVRTGPRPGGGWQVAARLPYRSEAS